MDDLEVRELRYFVAVAEELNFSRAAERLGIAQPPLSRAIKRIERRLGVRLFERDTRGVALTDAGSTMLAEARPALLAMSAVARRTQRAAMIEPRLLVTAKAGTATALLRRIVESHGRLPGVVPVEIVVSGYGRQAGMVLDGSADLAVLTSPYRTDGLETERLASEPRVAALPAGHWLAQRNELVCTDLDGEPIPQWPQWTELDRSYWSGWDTPAVGRAGRLPAAGPRVDDVAQLMEVVALGQAVALVPWSVASANRRTDVVYRPVTDASPYTYAIAWPQGDRSRAVATFVGHVMEASAADAADAGSTRGVA